MGAQLVVVLYHGRNSIDSLVLQAKRIKSSVDDESSRLSIQSVPLVNMEGPNAPIFFSGVLTYVLEFTAVLLCFPMMAAQISR